MLVGADIDAAVHDSSLTVHVIRRPLRGRVGVTRINAGRLEQNVPVMPSGINEQGIGADVALALIPKTTL